MNTHRLISDAEKLQLKSKIITLFGEMEKQKVTVTRVSFRTHIEYEDKNDKPKSEADLHREKIYKIEERSHLLENAQHEIARMNLLIAEASLYAMLINNESTVEEG